MHYFLDSNIIMYAIGKTHPYKESCQKIISAVTINRISVVTNMEVVQEILYRYISLGKRKDAFENAEDTMSLVTEIFPISDKDIKRAIRLLKKYPSLESRDAIHVASMLNNGFREILSTDLHFDMVTEIKRIDPAKFSL